jgi:hypothetical protein
MGAEPMLQAVPPPQSAPEEVPQGQPQPQPIPSPEMPKEMFFPPGPNSPHVQNSTPPANGNRPQLASAQLPSKQNGQPPIDSATLPAIFSIAEAKPTDWVTAPHGHLNEVRAKPTARAQAIAEGRLIDVSELARQIGFHVPVAITPAVWSICVSTTAENVTPNSNARLHDILSRLLMEAKAAENSSLLMINVTESGNSENCLTWQMQASCALGDDSEPEITIMLAEEGAPRK